MNPSTISNDFVATIGLDWADEKHDLWICPSQGKPEQQIIDQTPEAVHDWIAKLRQRWPTGKIALAVETSHGAIIYALMAYDLITIYPINPKALSKYREAFYVSGAKDDPTDAQLIEEMLRNHEDRLRPFRPQDTNTRTLLGLCEKRRHLVNGRTAAVKQCHAERYYPLARELLKDLTTTVAADFLLKWPDLASLKKAGAPGMRKFFYDSCYKCASNWLLDKAFSAS